ncbi:MAG: carbohydrate kinase family protein [Anaerolineae bacterium]|jgi:ribokinase|nr:carbohydrate kinase family protein [Anaerolineae bacterium]
MKTILVAGLINIETTLKVEQFPIPYFPVNYPFFGVNTTVSGVGYNLAKAHRILGNAVRLCTLIGPVNEPNAHITHLALDQDGILQGYIHHTLQQTPQSVILYDPTGRREIYTDLKDIQEQSYPAEDFTNAMHNADLLSICNINFAREHLETAQASGIPIATDVHVLNDPHDRYNADFMGAADILFLSDEQLPDTPENFLRTLYEIYHNEIIILGMGENGALLYEGRSSFMTHVPAVETRPVVNTIGAGDALFTSFCHCWLKTGNALLALRKAVVFAAHKIGEASAAAGFLSDTQLETWSKKIYG